MFYLIGLAEGVAGVSQVEANSVDEVFEKLPALKLFRPKLKVRRNRIGAPTPCDG